MMKKDTRKIKDLKDEIDGKGYTAESTKETKCHTSLRTKKEMKL